MQWRLRSSRNVILPGYLHRWCEKNKEIWRSYLIALGDCNQTERVDTNNKQFVGASDRHALSCGIQTSQSCHTKDASSNFVSNSVTFNQLPADQIKLGGASTTIVDQSRLLVYKNANFLGRNFACHQSTAYADLHHLARGFRTSSTVELQKPKRKWQFRLDSQILWGLHKASDRCWRIMRRAQSSTQECQHAFQVLLQDIQQLKDGQDVPLDPKTVVCIIGILDEAYLNLKPEQVTYLATNTKNQLIMPLMDLVLEHAATFGTGAIYKIVKALKTFCLYAKIDFPYLERGKLQETPQAKRIMALLDILAEQAIRRISQSHDAEPSILARLKWVYALHGGSPIQGRLFSLIDSKCYPCLSALPCWEFSYLVRGADRAQQQLSDEMYSGVVKESVLMLPKLQAKTAAQHLWCLSRLRQNRPLPQEVVEAASAPMIKGTEFLDFSLIGRVLWAIESAGLSVPPKLLEALLMQANADLHTAKPTSLCQFLGASIKLGLTSNSRKPLLLGCIQRIDSLLEECNSRTIVTALWGAASLQYQRANILSSGLLHRLNYQWAARLLELHRARLGVDLTMEIAIAAHAYAELQLDPLGGKFFQESLSSLEINGPDCRDAHALSQIFLAAATVQRPNFKPEFLKQGLGIIAEEGNSQGLCTTLWSLTAMNLINRESFTRLAERLTRIEFDETDQGVQQVLMAYTYVKARDPNMQLSARVASLIKILEKQLSKRDRQYSISRFHHEICKTLNRLKVPHAMEFEVPGKLASVDIVLLPDDRRPIALEADGFQHYTSLGPHRPLGRTVLRNKLLSILGFQIVTVPFFEWTKKNENERMTYLSTKLQQVGLNVGKV